MHHALTDLHAYVLVLDAEWRRLGERAEQLEQSDAVATERAELERRRTEITEELDALRATIAALRQQADPEGETL